jgi:hypothetical protein
MATLGASSLLASLDLLNGGGEQTACFFSDILHPMVVVRTSEIRTHPDRMSQYTGRTTSSFWRKDSCLEQPISLFFLAELWTGATGGAQMVDFEPELSHLD